MDIVEIVLAVFVGWVALGLLAARFCAMNTISEERDERVIDAAARELHEDMRTW
jgi:hypothetical protein